MVISGYMLSKYSIKILQEEVGELLSKPGQKKTNSGRYSGPSTHCKA